MRRAPSASSALALLLTTSWGGSAHGQDVHPAPEQHEVTPAAEPRPPVEAQPTDPRPPADGPAEPAAPGAPPAAPPQGAGPQITPPRALDTPHVEPPDGALEPGTSVSVGLRLTVDSDGQVTSAEVVQSVSLELDDLARSAALSFRFEPATNGGRPVAARVLYQYDFRAPPAPTPPVAAAAVPMATPEATVQPETAAGPPAEAAEIPEGEVHVRGQLSALEKLEKSADAVTVVRLDEARKRSADMGDILARTPGMVVRRSAGLGSDVRFALNGLYGSAVPTFIDAVPLWMSAFPENVGAIQVNLIDHVEIYRGVVPLRLSADALGGALNFVTNQTYENHASASWQMGSFETYRGTGLVQYRHEPSGFVARVTGYGDSARNNYPVNVEVTDDAGQLSPAVVDRFHDAYRAKGIIAETGFVDRKWAKRLLLKGYYSDSYKEIQNNQVMTVPYGEVQEDSQSGGAQLNYEQDLSRDVTLELLGAYSHRAFHFLDVSDWVYDWYGNQVRQRLRPGEIDGTARDQMTWRDAGFGRAMLEWRLTPNQRVLATTSPLYSTQTGDERRQLDPSARDPLAAQRIMAKAVSGIGHQLYALPLQGAPADRRLRQPQDYAFENLISFKNYVYHASSDEVLPGGALAHHVKDVMRFGISDGLRFGITPYLAIKASYEFATRLPEPYETFGDGMLTQPNLDLSPEVSHNANIGPTLDLRGTPTGNWLSSINGFLRDSNDMIVLLGNDKFYSYQNVYRARTMGVEGLLSWSSPNRFLMLDGNATYTDSRNASDEGAFADFKGDRIPNRPYFTAAWSARFAIPDVVLEKSSLQPFYLGRYVNEFFRGWESQGLRQYKQIVPTQVSHDVGITYSVEGNGYRWATTIECQNFTNEQLYDDFGLQRPGRAFYWKLTGDLF